MYLDVQSVTEKAGTRKAWVKYAYSEVQTTTNGGKLFASSVTLEAYKCKERTVAIIQEVLYDKVEGGKVVQSVSIPEHRLVFEDVVPDSLSEAGLNFACNMRLPAR